ncbi:hypothetical protein HELRODRAFT_159940 [Helobdella robusta]|uniref:Syndecan/Neurexin domain-containing protein n=1 Tax=Helobdella robusta TaxID=6412 RepID=T1EPL0_HELRO|nr:hypothetical protein HELRODRAFT_159940 [Helobdella robusta]ESO05862.1 hypothetical protein HELRODRAFT_159940 [Helobdella robusta]
MSSMRYLLVLIILLDILASNHATVKRKRKKIKKNKIKDLNDEKDDGLSLTLLFSENLIGGAEEDEDQSDDHNADSDKPEDLEDLNKARFVVVDPNGKDETSGGGTLGNGDDDNRGNDDGQGKNDDGDVDGGHGHFNGNSQAYDHQGNASLAAAAADDDDDDDNNNSKKHNYNNDNNNIDRHHHHHKNNDRINKEPNNCGLANKEPNNKEPNNKEPNNKEQNGDVIDYNNNNNDNNNNHDNYEYVYEDYYYDDENENKETLEKNFNILISASYNLENKKHTHLLDDAVSKKNDKMKSNKKSGNEHSDKLYGAAEAQRTNQILLIVTCLFTFFIILLCIVSMVFLVKIKLSRKAWNSS